MGAYLRRMVGFWPDARVPYEIDRVMLGEDRVRLIEEAIAHWEESTPLRFVPRAHEPHWLTFDKTDRDSSATERVPLPFLSPPEIKVIIWLQDEATIDLVIHEIGHAMGLVHEHQRPDRDRYVSYHADRTERDEQFAKMSGDEVAMPTGYDFRSIMHYSPKDFSDARTQWVGPGWTDIHGLTDCFVFLAEDSGRVICRDLKGDGAFGETLHSYDWKPGWRILSYRESGSASGGSAWLLVLWNVRSNQLGIWRHLGRGELTHVTTADLAGSATAAFATFGSGSLPGTIWCYDSASGNLRSQEFDFEGALSAASRAHNIGRNWDRLVLAGDHLVLYNMHGRAQIRTLDDAFESVAHDYDGWSAGWTTLLSYRPSWTGRCLFRLKADSGDMTVHRMESNGAVGDLVDQRSWTPGWTTAHALSSPDNRLYLLKNVTGEVHDHLIDGDGTIGKRLMNPVLTAKDPANQSIMGKGTRLSSQDIFTVCELYPGDVHTHLMQPPGSQGGMVGQLVERADWSSGWTVAEPFRVGSRQRLLVIKGSDGSMRLYEMEGGKLGRILVEKDWSSHWTHARAFTVGDRWYLMLLKESNGTMRLHEIDDNAMIGDLLREESWEVGWSSAHVAHVDGAPLLVLYNRHTGTLRVQSISPEGRFGEATERRVHFGYTSVETWTSGGKTFLLLLRSADGRVETHQLNADRTISPKLDSRDWTSGWTQAVPFQVNEVPYLFLLKSSNGDVHIHELGSDGRIGNLVHDNGASWSSGWDIVRFYSVGFFPFLILIKSGT